MGDADWLVPTGWWDLPQNLRWGSKADRSVAKMDDAVSLLYAVPVEAEESATATTVLFPYRTRKQELL